MPPFERYAAIAGEGKNSLPRILAGSVTILVLWTVGSFLVMAAGLIVFLAASGAPSYMSFDPAYLEKLFSSRIGLVALLLSIATIWPVTWFALRFIHRRKLSGLFGADRRLPGADFRRGLLAGLVVAILSAMIWLAADPTMARTDATLSAWTVALLPFALAVLLQSSAEELLFRGYLQQSLAHRFRSPLVWAGVPTVLFTLIHWYDGALAAMNAAGLLNIAAFAVAFAYIVYRTGNLAAAMGAHFGNNLVALLLLGTDDAMGATALYSGRSIDDPAWSLGQAVFLGLAGIAAMVLLVLLLLHPRSPLRLMTVPGEDPPATAQV